MNTTITAITTGTSYDFAFNKEYTMRKFLTNVVNREVGELEQHYANKLIAQLNKKNSTKSATGGKNAQENSQLMERIISFMESERTYTAKELAKAMTTEENEVSTQKITALMGKLKDNDTIVIIDGFKPDGAKTKCKGYRLA